MKVLYVGRDREEPTQFCPGSLVCMAITEKLEVPITVQDCSVLRKTQTLPDWLDGTPIYIDQSDPMPYRGTDAVRALQSIQHKEASTRREAPPPPSEAVAAPVASRGQPRMEAPRQTRQPATQHHRDPDQPLSPDAALDDFSEYDSNALPPDTMANGAGNAPIRDDKVTEDELQRFMEKRKQSPAAPAPNTIVPPP